MAVVCMNHCFIIASPALPQQSSSDVHQYPAQPDSSSTVPKGKIRVAHPSII